MNRTGHATKNIPIVDANDWSLQLAAKELGGDEHGLTEIIETEGAIAPGQRRSLIGFLATLHVKTIPHYPKRSVWYTEGSFKITYHPVRKKGTH